ncbi:cation:dicarboxylate symporter family transporter [Streptomyces sp. NPDC054834]
MGAEKSTVGLVVPTGYSFNLDGATIYLSLATLIIAEDVIKALIDALNT